LYTNSNFKRNYLENYNDSENAVKTKNAPFFMIFPNISFFLYGCKLLDWSFNGQKMIAKWFRDQNRDMQKLSWNLENFKI
jgi:hypothetical protein